MVTRGPTHLLAPEPAPDCSVLELKVPPSLILETLLRPTFTASHIHQEQARPWR